MPTITRLPLLDRYNHAGARRFTMHLALLGALATGITLTGPLGLVLVVPQGTTAREGTCGPA